jgi:hypothetical protein
MLRAPPKRRPPGIAAGTSIGKATLQVDPSLEVVANRPPSTFVHPGAAGQ